MRVATDVGGTFTDVVYYEVDKQSGKAGLVKVEKSDTTPPNFEQGVLDVIAKAGISPKEFDFFAHGSTVVINALLSRRGSKTALITTRGFRDVLEIARGNRPDLFNFMFEKPKSFVPRYLRCEITERLDPYGDVLQPVKIEEVYEIVSYLKNEGVEAIAVCLLHSYVNPNHEREIADRIKSLWPEVSVLASCDINREWREYERTSTTTLAAYVHPVAKKYLDSLHGRLDEAGLESNPNMMQSSGGIASVKAAMANPITMVESGPAGGVLGAMVLGKQIGEPNILALDIGGTTAKCALIENNNAKVSTEYKIECTKTNPGYPIHTPVFEIVEIGNGGGSIAWIDDGNKLHVGPVSAGALPGPVAYGKGGVEPTTTDAHLVTGRIGRDCFLGGAVEPDMEATYDAFQRLAEQLGGTVEGVARGVIRIANANMENALKLISVNKGYDPREFTLMAFGGGGAMHAVDLAESLGMKKVIIPANSSVFSAWGMLMTDLRRDLLRTKVVALKEEYLSELNSIFDLMADEVAEEYQEEGLDKAEVGIQLFGDFRYLGQEHTVKIALPSGAIDKQSLQEIIGRFHKAHEREYSLCHPDSEVQIVNFHVVGSVEVSRPDLPKLSSTGRLAEDVKRGSRNVDYPGYDFIETPIYDLDQFEPGMTLEGPAVVENKTTTVVVSPNKQVEMDSFGNLIINL